MRGGSGGRREDRLVSCDPAVMMVSDGRRIAGSISNMNLGGMLFVAEDESTVLERGMSVEVAISLYGRESKFSCTVAHQQDNRFGLQLRRSPSLVS